MITMGMTAASLAAAQLEVSQVVGSGQSVILAKPGTKNKLGEEIGTSSTLTFHAFPVRYAPFTRKLSNQISWADDVSVILYLSKYDVSAQSQSVEKLKRYKTATLSGAEYQIDQVENYLAFGSDFLYVLVGLKK